MRNKKAFATLEIKSTEDKGGKRTFNGVASTPSSDRADDIVEPKGAEFKLPLPFLWQHSHKDPIGWITKVKVTDKEIEVDGEVATIEEEGELKKFIDKAWQSLKAKLVRGLSIGFSILESSDIKNTWGEHITKWEWLELSAVTIPCNQDCTISTVKSAYNTYNKTASGHNKNSGDSDSNMRIKDMKTLQEQLEALEEARANKSARLNELSDLIRNKTASSEDGTEFDGIEDEIKRLDDDIRLKKVEIMNSKTIQPIVQKTKMPTGPTFYHKSPDKDEEFEGQNYTRKLIAKAAGMLANVSPVAIAQKRWGISNPQLVGIIKADVEGGNSVSGSWGAELVSSDNRYTADFIKFLYSMTVFDKLPLTEVPAYVTIKGQDGAATANWVGESKAIPVSAQDFKDVSLTPLKVAALAVISNELIKHSSPSAEKLVRDALVQACSQKVDATFFSVAAASANVSPAGILNGLTPESASGTDADALRTDLKTLTNIFIAAKNASDLHICMNPALAKSIQMLYNALGVAEFPNINQNGGQLFGDPVHTGHNINASHLIMLRPADIYKIGDTGLEMSMSREATIEMSDAPAMDSQAPTAATGKSVGMFQTESTAIKIVRPINFLVRRDAAKVVNYINDALYDNSTS